MDKVFEDYFYSKHSKETLRRWLSQLNYFCFKRATGGHANDGDTFIVSFIFPDRKSLIEQVNRIGLTPGFSDDNNWGRNLLGRLMFWRIKDNRFELDISGTADSNYYEVSEADFNTCVYLEKEFDRLSWLDFIDRSIEKSSYIVSKGKFIE